MEISFFYLELFIFQKLLWGFFPESLILTYQWDLKILDVGFYHRQGCALWRGYWKKTKCLILGPIDR